MADSVSLEPGTGTYVVRAGGAVLGETSRAMVMHEDGREPVVYFPREDVAMAFLESSTRVERDPVKGDAGFFSIVTRSSTLPEAAWTYVDPNPDLHAISEYVAFDAAQVTVEEV